MRMRRKKNLEARIDAVQALLVENPSEHRGKWRSLHTPDTPLHLELGCGKGQFARALAARNPDALIIAVEMRPNVLVAGVEAALREGLPNLRFVSGDADMMHDWFAPGEIDRLYINFCDPWPHRKKAGRRLVYRGFLDKYRPLLRLGGTLQFKTDNAPLFAFAQKELAAAGWIIVTLQPDLPRGGNNIETEYETRFRAMDTAIGYLEARPTS